MHLCNSPGYRRNLPLCGMGHQISQTIEVKAHKIYFSAIFWPIFGILEGEL